MRVKKEEILSLLKKIFKTRFRVAIFVVLVIIIGFSAWRIFASREQPPQYQTTQTEKGTLIVVVTASGQVTQANSATVETQASGVVSKIYVENGQKVKTGDKIAELDLDLVGKQRSSQAWASYQSAKNSLETAKINYYTLQSEMLTKWKTYKELAESSSYQNPDGSPKTDTRQLPQFYSTMNDWLAAEAKYKNQENVVTQAQTAFNSAWLSYQQTSPIIYAPISGTVTGLSLQEGTVLVAQSSSLGSATAQKIASIKTNAAAQLAVNLTEIDVTKIKIGNKATVALDAFPGKTYTGKVVSIDTIGTVSSGVTTYPAVIGLDTEAPEILPNMAANAKIITNVIENVILVPNAAVQTAEGQSIVKVMRNGKVSEVTVEVAGSNDAQTAITSGLSESETVVTSIISAVGVTTGQQTSPFGGFGGGGAFRISR